MEGETILYFPFGIGVPSLKIGKYLTLSFDEKRVMGLAGRKIVETKFDRRIVVDAYLRTVTELS